MKVPCTFLLSLLYAFDVLSGENKFLERFNWTVVVTVSKWYDDLFQNWFYWYKSLNLHMDLVLVAEDTYMFNKYNNYSDINVFFFDLNQVMKFGKQPEIIEIFY